MKRTIGLACLGILATALLSSPVWGPHVLSRVAWFDVERVEISGTRLLAPHEVLASSAIRHGQSIWTDPEAWEAALRANPSIADARVTRKLPNTLRIRVREKLPVAYVERATLEPVTASGEILPIDPTRAPVDLPILSGAWERKPATTRATLLGETARLSRVDPALVAEISEIRPMDGSTRTLLLSHRLGEIVIPAGATSDRLAQLRAVLSDLEGRLPAADSVSTPARIDLRFSEQIIVRLPSSVSIL